MPNVSAITDKCIKDMLCVDSCLRNAIHPREDEPRFAQASQLFINPRKCMNCGSCISVCESGAIFEFDELPDDLKHFAEINAAFYKN